MNKAYSHVKITTQAVEMCFRNPVRSLSTPDFALCCVLNGTLLLKLSNFVLGRRSVCQQLSAVVNEVLHRHHMLLRSVTSYDATMFQM